MDRSLPDRGVLTAPPFVEPFVGQWVANPAMAHRIVNTPLARELEFQPGTLSNFASLEQESNR